MADNNLPNPSDSNLPVEESFDFGEDRAYKEMLKLLEEKPLLERLKSMFEGFSKPKDSGEYKFAKLQFERLSAPFFGFLCVLVMVGLMLVFGNSGAEKEAAIRTEIFEPETVEEIDEPPPPPDEIQPVEDFDTEITDMPIAEVNVQAVNNQPLSAKPAAANSVAIVKSPIVFKGVMGSRNPGQIGASRAQYGGSAASEAAVLRALRWLKTKQSADGSWPKNKPSMTGLALLCYLAHGETPASEEFGSTVENGIQYLCRTQNANGTFQGADGNQYAHLIATYALCEAYSMTKVPMVKEACEKALPFIVRGQHPNGGWDYKMAQTERDDTSVMGWAAQAVKAGYMAGDLDVPGLKECFENAPKGFLVNYHKDGGFGYTGPSHTSGLTAVGVLCMQLMGHGNDEAVKKSLEVMDEWTLGWGREAGKDVQSVAVNGIPAAKVGSGSNPQYYAYYATQCMFQNGGTRWTNWNKKMSDIYHVVQIKQSKETSGYVDHKGAPQETGYWENDDGNKDNGGVMDTALTCLQLEVYYRYLPTFKHVEVVDTPAVLKSESEAEAEIELF